MQQFKVAAVLIKNLLGILLETGVISLYSSAASFTKKGSILLKKSSAQSSLRARVMRTPRVVCANC